METRKFWRFQVAGMALAFFGVAIVGQSIRIQQSPEAQEFIYQSEFYSKLSKTIDPPRGQIYDRSGNLLAGNRTVYEIGVELTSVREGDPEAIAIALSALVGADYNTVLEIASRQPTDTAVYAVLANYILPENIDLLKAYNVDLPRQSDDSLLCSNDPQLSSLICQPHLMRSYPEKELASNLLGFVNRDGIGNYGIEQQYQQLLTGKGETFWIPTNPSQAEEYPDIRNGASLVLTIDREIQAMIEGMLAKQIELMGAESGTAIVMHPKTGEILAMVSTPVIDLNEYWNYPELYTNNTPFNRAISETYEPGSIFKVITMAAALDAEAVKPEDTFLDNGYIEVGGIGIRNWNRLAWGQQDMLGCMQNSLNVCFAWIGQELGAEDFYDYLAEFGFGNQTGIDLAGEADGRVKEPGDSDWYPADLGTNTFGQGIAVTPIQMVMAVSALMNEGQMVIPHMVKSIIQDGAQYNIPTQYANSPISAETAETLETLMESSLENGTQEALVSGYRMAGKTGTAQVPGEDGYYLADKTNTSFIGWGPSADPQFIVYLWLEKPEASIWADDVVAPLFSEIAERLVVLMDIPPDSIQAELLAEAAE